MSTSDLKVDIPPASVDVPLVAVPQKLPVSRTRRKMPDTAKTVESKASGQPQPSPPLVAQVAKVDSEKIDNEKSSESPTSGRSSVYRFLLATPSWLISCIVHLAAILFLATYVVVSNEKPTVFYVLGNPTEDAEPLLFEPTTLTPEIQNTSDIAANSPLSESLGFTDVGDVSEAAQGTASLGSGELKMSPMGDIGEVFGGKGNGMASTGVSGHSAEFFGVKATGRKFVFIVDSSNSMRMGKFDDAKKELMYSLARLSKDQFFYVIFFDHDAERMRLFPNSEPEEKAVRATIENVKRVEQWVNTVENERKTDPSAAVKFAVEMLPDAIYLLSDGQFTDRGQTVRYLKDHNVIDDPIDGKHAKVVIHTVGFYSQEGEENLKSIAKTYGGTYRFVPKPEKKK